MAFVLEPLTEDVLNEIRSLLRERERDVLYMEKRGVIRDGPKDDYGWVIDRDNGDFLFRGMTVTMGPGVFYFKFNGIIYKFYRDKTNFDTSIKRGISNIIPSVLGGEYDAWAYRLMQAFAIYGHFGKVGNKNFSNHFDEFRKNFLSKE